MLQGQTFWFLWSSYVCWVCLFFLSTKPCRSAWCTIVPPRALAFFPLSFHTGITNIQTGPLEYGYYPVRNLNLVDFTYLCLCAACSIVSSFGPWSFALAVQNIYQTAPSTVTVDCIFPSTLPRLYNCIFPSVLPHLYSCIFPSVLARLHNLFVQQYFPQCVLLRL